MQAANTWAAYWLAFFGASVIVLIVFWCRSVIRNGIMRTDGRWIPPTTPGLATKAIIGFSFVGFGAALLVAVGLTVIFAPQALWSLKTLMSHS